MAFSIFNKKNEPPVKPRAGAVTAAQPLPATGKPAPASPAPAAKKPGPAAPQGRADLSSKIDRIEAEIASRSFDQATRPTTRAPQARDKLPPAALSSPVKPAPGAARPSATAAPAPGAQSGHSVKSSKPVIERGFNPAPGAAASQSRPAAPSAAPAAAKPPQPSAVKANAAPLAAAAEVVAVQGVSSVMMMQLAASPFEAAPVLEQAAIMYAKGEDLEARDALHAELTRGAMPPTAAREGWMLLFDLLENLGHSDEFESAALDFAVAFETSPPPYTDRSGVRDPMLETGGGQYFALTSALDVTAAGQFAQLVNLAERKQVLRLEFGKVEMLTAEGCTLLLDHLRRFKKSGCDMVFSNAEHLMKLLTRSIKPGRRSDPEVFWMLLLELCQFQHMQAGFEKVALNYCVTYEVSPPSWAEPERPTTNAHSSGAISVQVPQDAFYIRGLLRGDSADLLAEIGAYAADKPKVVIDFFDVRRVDAESAGAISNLVSAMFFQGKEIEIRSPSPLIATLFVSLGMAHEASFTQRGF